MLCSSGEFFKESSQVIEATAESRMPSPHRQESDDHNNIMRQRSSRLSHQRAIAMAIEREGLGNS